MIPTEVSWLGVPGTVLFALLLLSAVTFFALTASRRFQLLTAGGGADPRWDRVGERLRGVVELGILQRRMFRDPYAGLYHILIFSGFVVLSVRTASLVLEGLFPAAGMPFLPAGAWHAYLTLKDVVLLTTLAGVLLALGRRHLFRKERLDPSFDADLILLLIAFLMATDLGAGAAKANLFGPEATPGEPVTLALSGALSGLSSGALHATYQFCWWSHLVAVLVFLNYLPFAKHFHVITALPNLFFRKLEPPGKLQTFDIEKAAEAEKFGVGKIEDFTWKQKLDMFTCTECGRCRENCPTHLTGKPLSPKGYMIDLRKALYTDGPALVEAASGVGDGTAGKRLAERRELIGGWVDEETVWACTTCRYCESACPVGITYTDKLVDMRRYLVLEKSEFPKEAQTAFNGMERQGNPWNLPAADRDAWAGELPFEVPVLGALEEAERAKVEVLFWVGCAGSYEERGMKVSRSLATLLHRGGVEFAILGSEETCNGDSARRLGNEYLFQTLAQQNVETLNGYGVKKIVTNCPHCLNTLKNEYPDFGGKFEVVHGTELVAQLVAEGKLKLEEKVETTVSFHDPCYLGRHNDVYDAPRAVLAAIPGVKLTELPRTRDKGVCCGAGGGRMWLDEKIGARINQMRYAEVEGAGTAAVGVACPFCMVMLGNARSEMNGKTEPFDVLELAARALPASSATQATSAPAG
ncbi:4Fe-4S dicluster domain-containing protein [Acidobacteria bacterium ACD]|nr:MAG: 4Fe-4S dicluster domain-containing protein [Acidobacteriota bacterium]MDL1949078.1 4Fe-4S dicluster domain-containing protein [Acidobacteria bacterium ACD]